MKLHQYISLLSVIFTILGLALAIRVSFNEGMPFLVLGFAMALLAGGIALEWHDKD